MNQQNHIMNAFTNKYSLQKTLRFELIPQGKTKELVRTLFTNPEEYHHELIKKDLELSERYKRVKKLIDCMHRNIIYDVLNEFKFTKYELEKLNKSADTENNEENTEEYSDTKDPLAGIRKRLATELAKKNKIMFDNKLLNPNGKNENGKCELEKWIDKADNKYLELGNDKKVDKDSIKTDVQKLKGWFTYFGGFNKNRENIYSDKKISTAIPSRIVHDNFPIFKENIENYEKIKKEHPELATLLDEKGANGIFKLDYFNSCLTQEGIDIYNSEKLGIIAKEQGKEQDKGINQLINEYTQKKNKKLKENAKNGENPKKIKIATFDKLKKQILSINKTKSFRHEVFEDTSEIIEGINKRYEFLNKPEEGRIIDTIRNFIGNIDNDEYDLNEIYLNEKSIGIISKKLFDHGRYVETALKKWYDDKINQSGTHKIKFFSAKQFSIQLIQDSISNYLQKYETNEELRNKYSNKKVVVDYFKNPTITIEHEQNGEKTSEEKPLFDELEHRKDQIKHILNGNYTKDLKEEKQIGGDAEKVKAFLDALLDFNYILSPFIIKNKRLRNEQEEDKGFYNEIKTLRENVFEAEILDLYNQTRNYVTKKPYKLDKFKLTFEDTTLLEHWPEPKHGIIFRRDLSYYLGIPNDATILNDPKKDPKGTEDIISMMKYQQTKAGQLTQNLMVVDNKTKKINGKKINILEDNKIEFENKILSGEIENNIFKVEIDNTLVETKIDKNQVNIKLELAKNKYLPEEINKIRKRGSYNSGEKFNKGDLNKFIDFYKQRIYEYQNRAFSFKETEEYKNFKEFTDDIDRQAYELTFEKISYQHIMNSVTQGKLHLFKIHNKDFNKGSKGSKNLHTLYWEMLFDEKNFKNVVFKLNGGAELFYREASILRPYIHNTSERAAKKFFKLSEGTLEPVPEQSIINLNKYFKGQLQRENLTETDLKYINNYSTIHKKDGKPGIIKDERFTVDKIQFHCPITINFNSKNENSIDNDVLSYLHKNDDVHIIGLDRGERHLIYLTMINKEGQIVDKMQFSLNELQRKYTSNGKEEIQKIDYQKLLNSKEVSRTEARKNWQTIENIKNLKEGYLSLLIHQLAKLMIEKNAILVMENLNYGFKDSRARVEKQIYQKFESMLIKKLQYLVLDKNENNKKNVGGVLKGYQLTNQEVPAYKSISKQNGFLFYVPPDYTSKIDPVSGFVNLLDTRYYSRENAIALLEKFDKIYYDSTNKYFRFEFDYKKFGQLRVDVNEFTRAKWSVCAHSGKRSIAVQVSNNWVRKPIEDINDKLIGLFEEEKIEYENGDCMKTGIFKVKKTKFFEDLLKYLSVILALRHTYTEKGVENDLIVSSVEKTPYSNEFFVSKEGNDLPANADANGAYNIARKGLWLLNQLDKIDNMKEAVEKFNELKKAKKIIERNGENDSGQKNKWKSQWCSNKEWLEFAQSK